MKNNISIIILIYEEKFNVISECLEQLRDFSIIIVDNANNITRKEKIEKNFNIYKYFLNKNNLGFGKAVNKGIKSCSTDYLLILNPDCIITASSIKILLEKLNEYKDCFMTTPTLFTNDNKITQNSSLFPESGVLKSPISINGDICCQSILAAAMFCRTNDIKEIGMFDENFFLFYEDDDLCRRIYNLKKSIIQTFNAKAIHQHGEGKSIKNSLKRSFIINFNMTYSELYYFFKIKSHKEKFKLLRKKIPSYSIKCLLNLLIFRLNKSVYFFAKIVAYIKFKNFLKRN